MENETKKKHIEVALLNRRHLTCISDPAVPFFVATCLSIFSSDVMAGTFKRSAVLQSVCALFKEFNHLPQIS